MTEQTLQDAILRQSLQLLRLTAGEQAQVDTILRQMEADLRQLLASEDLSAAGKAQVKALIDQADEIITAGYGTAASSTDTRALALIVAQQTADFIGEVIPREILSATPERLASLTTDVLIDGAASSAWWSRQSEDLAFRFAAQVRQGMAANETQEQIVSRIVGKSGEPGIMETARRNARALVHSSVMSAANSARLATFRKNKRLIKGVRYLATLDGHICPRCAALDHQAWDLDGKALPGTSVKFLPPPLHFGCFPGGTAVLSRRPITGATKRWFDGEVVVIKTAAGRELTCTPNHPILTDSGWVHANTLNVGGNVVCDGGSEWEALGDGDGENAPASIHHVAEAFFASRQMLPMPVEVSPEDFHGDGVGSKVAIVWSDGLLRSDSHSLCGQHFRQSLFISGSTAGLVGFAGGSGLAERLERRLAALHNAIGALGHALPIGRSCKSHPGELLLTPVSEGDLVAPEYCQHDHARHSEPSGNAVRANTGGVGIDDITFSASGLDDGGPNSFSALAQGWEAIALQDAVNDFAGSCKSFGNLSACLTSSVGGQNLRHGDIAADIPTHDNAGSLEFSNNPSAGSPDLASDFFTRPPSGILLDEITDIDRISFSGHVYNLETSGGWYVAQGVVVHNCRCVLTPIPKTFRDMGLDIPEPADAGQRASSDGPVAGNTTFNAFLKRQSPAFVEQVLGKKRADLFRAGKITVKDLISGAGRELSLDELQTL